MHDDDLPIELVTYSLSRRASCPADEPSVLTTHFHREILLDNESAGGKHLGREPGARAREEQGRTEEERVKELRKVWYLLPMHQQGHHVRGLGSMTLTRGVTSVPPVSAPPTFYVDLESPEKDLGMEIQPVLLPDERVISKADRVCSYSTSATGMTSGQTGCLFVTTLRLSLKLHVEEEVRRNKVLGDLDVTLSSIEAVYELYGENLEKRRRLALGSTVSNRVEAIFVLCKNFQFLRLSFKFAGVDTGRNITNTLLHHSRPKKSELLFAFDQQNFPEDVHRVLGFREDVWESVLKLSEATNHRVSLANESWQVSTSLPRQFVVPGHVTDEKLAVLAGLGLGTRPPVWVWGTKAGGALYVQPQSNVTHSEEVNRKYGNFYHKEKGGERDNIDLDAAFPHSVQLEDGYTGMLELHCMETEKEAEEKDNRYFSSLESTGWMSTVGAALRLARDVAERLTQGRLIVLTEGEGRCISPLICSLAQLLSSEKFRSRIGFETLVQTNWVSLGFPFSRLHTLANLSSKPTGLNPTFLLFLDCVHQICFQFPSKIEFQPQYLIHVWDTAFVPVFDTFLFDCEHDRVLATSTADSPPHRYTAWDWHVQFSPQQIAAWDNPLYGVPLRPPRKSPWEPNEMSMLMGKEVTPILPESRKSLPISGAILNLEVWYQLFHRSVPFLQPDRVWPDKLNRVRSEAKGQVTRLMSATHVGGNDRRSQHGRPR